MIEFFQLLVLGMATGGFYTLNALGMVVVFRSSGIINFAAGGLAMVGGYCEWQLADQWHLPRGLAVVGAILLAAAFGLAIYQFAIRPLSATSTLTKVIATLAILVSLQQAVILIFGGLPKVPTPFLPATTVHLGDVAVGLDDLLFVAVTVALTGLLWAIYRWTRFGLATSALAEDPRSLAALGWSPGRLRAANWAIGGALAGATGAGLGPLLQLNTGNFAALLVPTLAGATLAGLRSFPLTLGGCLLIGVMQAEANAYITWAHIGDAVPFLVIILVLMVRGRRMPLRSFVQERLPRVGTGQVDLRRICLLLVVVAALAQVLNPDWVIGSTITLTAALLLLSQVVITGYAGQLSLAQLTMGGAGAIIAARFSAGTGAPFLVSLLVGMLAVIPMSVLVGLPSLRARGASLAVATLGFGVAINAVVLNNSSLNGGSAGLTLTEQHLFGFSIDATEHPGRYFVVTLVVFTLMALAVTNMRRGRIGRRALAIRSNERAAAALGIDVTGTKLYAFVVAGILAGASGTLTVFAQVLPQFNGFDPVIGLSNLVTVVLGGIGYVLGAILGGLFNNNGLPNAVLYPVTGNLTWWNNLFPLALGVILVLQLVANPNGIADSIVHRGRRAGRLRGRWNSWWNAGLPRVSGLAKAFAVITGPPRAERQLRVLEQHQRQVTAAAGLIRHPRGGALRVSDLRVRFGSVMAVNGISLCVCPGEVLAVIGPNGAGKTTLMDAITGFVPASGTIELDSRRIDGLPTHQRARLGVVRSFQSLELLEDMSVMDNLRCAADPQDRASMILDLFRPERAGVTFATQAAITAFGLADSLHRTPTEIGYGERRLVAIARAVASEPAVLLLDEPAAGLSESERARVATIITRMAKDWNIAVLLIEHDVALVRRVSDHVIALNFGEPIATGTPDEVLSHPAVITAYLGSPDTRSPITLPSEPTRTSPLAGDRT